MKKDYRLIGNLAWEAFRIPIYLYKEHELIECFPNQEAFCYPPEKELSKLWASSDLASSTDTYGLFVKLPCISEDDMWVVCGPVSSLKPTRETLSLLHREYLVAPESRQAFDEFFCSIPNMTQGEYFRQMQVIYYMLNDSEVSLEAFLSQIISSSDESKQIARNQHAEATYNNSEFGSRNNSYEIETLITDMVRRGDTDAMSNFISSIPAYHAGTVARDFLRLQKNYLIILTSLVARAAIDAGLPSERAFSLSDLYITKLESFNSIDAINHLNAEVLRTFTELVKEHLATSIVPAELDDLPEVIRKCMQYIRSHTNQKITVYSISKEFGYDRSYLSHLFAETLGFTMSAYITRCKLEESRILLSYTDKSLREIANYLCFSSQSHFQKCFKETFHITPQKYREHKKTSRLSS